MSREFVEIKDPARKYECLLHGSPKRSDLALGSSPVTGAARQTASMPMLSLDGYADPLPPLKPDLAGPPSPSTVRATVVRLLSADPCHSRVSGGNV